MQAKRESSMHCSCEQPGKPCKYVSMPWAVCEICVSCLQGESLWLHMQIIEELANMCHSVFQGGSVQYAYTTIPTYPRRAELSQPASPGLHHQQGEAVASFGCKHVGGWPDESLSIH